MSNHFSHKTAGKWSDRIQNRKIILILQSIAITVSTALAAYVSYTIQVNAKVEMNTMWILFLLSRVILGLLGNLIMIVFTYVGDLSDETSKSSNFGLIGMSLGLAFTVGPGLGGFLSSRIDNRVYFPFAVSTLFCLLTIVYAFIFVEDSIKLKRSGQSSDNGPSQSKTSIWSLIAESNPLRSFGLVFTSGRKVLFASLSVFLFGLGNTGFFSIWINYSDYRYKFTSYENGLFLTGIGAGYAVFQGVLMKLFVRKLGDRRCAIVCLLMSALTNFMLGAVTEGWMAYTIIPVASFASMGDPLLKSIISKQVDESKQGALQGALQSLITLSGIISPILMFQLFTRFTAIASPGYLVGAPFYFCSTVLVVSSLIMTVYVPESTPTIKEKQQ